MVRQLDMRHYFLRLLEEIIFFLDVLFLELLDALRGLRLGFFLACAVLLLDPAGSGAVATCWDRFSADATGLVNTFLNFALISFRNSVVAKAARAFSAPAATSCQSTWSKSSCTSRAPGNAFRTADYDS